MGKKYAEFLDSGELHFELNAVRFLRKRRSGGQAKRPPYTSAPTGVRVSRTARLLPPLLLARPPSRP
jgi:hypothetical protein